MSCARAIKIWWRSLILAALHVGKGFSFAFILVTEVFCPTDDESKLPKPDDGRKKKPNPLNDNFNKKEFQELWARINKKATRSFSCHDSRSAGKSAESTVAS